MYYRPQRRSVLFTAPGLVIGALAAGAAGGISVSPAEILALIEKPHLLVAVLFVGAVAGIMIEQALSRMRRQAWRSRNRSQWQEKGTTADTVVGSWAPTSILESSKRPDATEQLRIVMNSTFTIQPLLNKSEARVFKELDRLVIGCNPTWQVMAQVSLGEILRSKDPNAFSCINAKRVDLLLVDGNCQPRHAIEYQGGAHHQGAAAARDAVKKEALRRAGIGYFEVVAGQTTPSDLKRLVEKLVDKPELPKCGSRSIGSAPPGSPLTCSKGPPGVDSPPGG